MRTVLVLLASAAALAAQQAPPPPPPPPPPPQTIIGSPVSRDSLDYDVPLALSGRILLDDRQVPPEPIPVEYLCHGSTLGTLTDAKGKFSITIGFQQATRADVLLNPVEIEGCRLQIRVQGFEEVVVSLKRPHRPSDLSLGDFTLKAIGPKGSAGFSESGLNAPAKARSNYVRAFESINGSHYPEAIALLDKAIAAYPKYASALQLKAVVLERTGQRDAARQACLLAVAADPAYAKPLVQLAEMAAEDQNPEEAARWASMANRLAPGAYPGLYLVEGGAYFDLKRYEDAERAVREGIGADPKSGYPRLRKLMGEVLYQKRNYAAALEQFEWYLKEAPEAADIVSVQTRVQACKRLAKATGSQTVDR